ncbi:uncharacterized protein LOC116070788 [Mastomys coucha]|uniref:uncharacterized protein LOC116070788 n=1 Tax=Mastomys coucha TaxID=35658 RepID=UPI001261418C|nr:uncharacterized protein LOC116070788 [Mastomys coucha]
MSENPALEKTRKKNRSILGSWRLPQREVTDSGHRLTGAAGAGSRQLARLPDPLAVGTPILSPVWAASLPHRGRESQDPGAAGLEPGHWPPRPQSETCASAPK